MEEAIQELLDKYSNDIISNSKLKEDLISRIEFAKIHNFKEEQRVAQLQLDSVSFIIYNFENMYNSLKEILNNWNK